MNAKKIHAEINGTMDELLQLIYSVDGEMINVVPFEGSWTAGQLAKHLVISGSGFIQALNGPVNDTDRPIDNAVEKIKADFLDFNTKMKSPAFVVPPKILYDKDELVRSVTDLQANINHAIKTLNLSKTCLAFELPVYGFMTRLETIYFILYHTQRHIHQLRKIIQRLPARDAALNR